MKVSFWVSLLLVLSPALAWSDEKRPSIIPDASFEFQFGQGSGLYGLDVLKVTADGKDVYEYQQERGRNWQRKRFFVDKASLLSLVDKINKLKLLDMERLYTSSMNDGTQWCVLIKMEGKSKSIYCNNQFPQQIKELSQFVHETVIESRSKDSEAETVPKGEYRKHEKELWESIKK